MYGTEERVCIDGTKAVSVSDAQRRCNEMQHTIELVKVAGTAIIIHHARPVMKSFPLPLIKFPTSFPSRSAT